MTRDEERRLVQQAQAGDDAARNRLVEANYPFLLHFTRGHPQRADAVQECALALMRSIRRFDLDRHQKVRLVTYAKPAMRHALSDAHFAQSFAVRIPPTAAKAALRGDAAKHARAAGRVFGCGRAPPEELTDRGLSPPDEAALREALNAKCNAKSKTLQACFAFCILHFAF